MHRLWIAVLLTACGRYNFSSRDGGNDGDAAVDTAVDGAANAPVFSCSFDEPAGPYACGSLVATCSGPCPQSVASPHGNGLTFNATGDVQVGTTAISGTGYTVSVWFLATPTVTGALLGKPLNAASNLDSFGLFVSNSTGGLYYETTDGAAPQYAFDPAPTDLRDSTWHHAAAVWDGTIKTLYLDGSLSATQAIPVVDSLSPLYVGGDRDMGAPGFRLNGGAVDELRVYARALTALEITALAQ